MSDFYYIQKTFHKGIIDDTLYARTDTNFLNQGVSEAENVSITTQGTLEKRPGINEELITNSIPSEFNDHEVIDIKYITIDNIIYLIIAFRKFKPLPQLYENYFYIKNLKDNSSIINLVKSDFIYVINNENLSIINTVKINKTQVLITTSIAWFILNLPNIETYPTIITNDLSFYSINLRPYSIFAYNNYNDSSFLNQINKNLIKQTRYSDTCSSFYIENLDGTTANDYITVNTKVRIYIKGINTVELKKLWAGNIYEYAGGTNHAIFFIRGIYILSQGSIAGTGPGKIQNENDTNTEFYIDGYVLEGSATIKNEQISNTTKWGINGNFLNGDLIFFDQWQLYKAGGINSWVIQMKPIYPQLVSTYQGRLITSNNIFNNDTVWVSQVNDLDTFFGTRTDPIYPFSFSICNKEKILQIETGKKLSIMTENGIYAVVNSLETNLTPTNFNINKINEFVINKDIKAVEYDNKLFYVQSFNNNIHAITTIDEKNNIYADELADLTCHSLFENKKIIDIIVCTTIGDKTGYLFVLMYTPNISNSLEIAVCLSNKQQEMLGWTIWNLNNLSINNNITNYKLLFSNNKLYIMRTFNMETNKNVSNFKFLINEFNYSYTSDNIYVSPLDNNKTNLNFNCYIKTTPITATDNTIGDLIYKPYKISSVSVSAITNKVICNNIDMTKVQNFNIHELKSFIGQTGYLSNVEFKNFENNAFELLGLQFIVNYSGDVR